MDWIDEIIVLMKKNGIKQKTVSCKSGLSEHSISNVLLRRVKARKSTRTKIETAVYELIN